MWCGVVTNKGLTTWDLVYSAVCMCAKSHIQYYERYFLELKHNRLDMASQQRLRVINLLRTDIMPTS